MMNPNEVERRRKAAKFYEESSDFLMNLFARWMDEKDFEDIKDYGKVIAPKVEAIGGAFLAMTKRPFGFTYTLMGATYQIKISQTTYSYNRIK